MENVILALLMVFAALGGFTLLAVLIVFLFPKSDTELDWIKEQFDAD